MGMSAVTPTLPCQRRSESPKEALALFLPTLKVPFCCLLPVPEGVREPKGPDFLVVQGRLRLCPSCGERQERQAPHSGLPTALPGRLAPWSQSRAQPSFSLK